MNSHVGTKKLNYLKELEEKIHSLHQQGCSETEINQGSLKKYPITSLSMGEWDTIHVIRSFLNESYS